MKVAILIPPKDFKDESVSQAKLMLEKWNIRPVITSYSTHDCVGYHGAVYKPEINAGRITAADFDAIILIDGHGVDSYRLYDFRPLLDLVKQFHDQGKLVCSINNSMKIIARANIISDVKVAVPDEEESKRLVLLYRGKPSEKDVELDKNILTLNNSESIDIFIDRIIDQLGAR